MKSAVNFGMVAVMIILFVAAYVLGFRPSMTNAYFENQCIDECQSRGEQFDSGGGDKCDGYCNCFVAENHTYNWNAQHGQSYQVSNWESFGTVSVWEKLLLGKCMI